jgi:hypothetical protein
VNKIGRQKTDKRKLKVKVEMIYSKRGSYSIIRGWVMS